MTTKTDTAAATTAAPASASAPAPTPEKGPAEGAKVAARFVDPGKMLIVGIDTPEPDPADSKIHPVLHRIYQAERNRDIKRDGTADLEATIEAIGRVVSPISIVKVKDGDGVLKEFVAFGRRRVLAARAINERRAKANLQPLMVPAIAHDPNDTKSWFVVRAENSGRKDESPMAIASDVALMWAGNERLGIPKMTHEEIGRAYGKNHQFSRAFLDLHGSSDRVKVALAKNQLSLTGATQLASLKSHEDQDKALDAAIEASKDDLAAGMQIKAATARAAAAQARGNREVTTTAKSVTKVREAVAGLEWQIKHLIEKSLDDKLTDNDRAELPILVGAHAALRWQLGEPAQEWPGLDAVSDTATVVLANSEVRGEDLAKKAAEAAKTDAVKAKEAEKATAEKAKADEKEKAKADKEAARAKKKADVEALKAAEKEIAKNRKGQIAESAQRQGLEQTTLPAA